MAKCPRDNEINCALEIMSILRRPHESFTLAQIADITGMSVARVAVIERCAIRKIRRKLKQTVMQSEKRI